VRGLHLADLHLHLRGVDARLRVGVRVGVGAGARVRVRVEVRVRVRVRVRVTRRPDRRAADALLRLAAHGLLCAATEAECRVGERGACRVLARQKLS